LYNYENIEGILITCYIEGRYRLSITFNLHKVQLELINLLTIQKPVVFFFNLCVGTLGAAAATGLMYQPRMIGKGDCGEIGGMKIGKGNRSTRRKPSPPPLCPPQIPRD
jgi:hypothetical protein